MSSNLKVNTILPSVGTAIGIGTAGGSLSMTSDTLTFSSSAEKLRINSDGRLLIGSTSVVNVGGASNSGYLQIEGTSTNSSSVSLINNQNTTQAPVIRFGKTRGTSTGSVTTVANGDLLGRIAFAGADGTDLQNSTATIEARANGTIAGNQIPTDLVFETSATSGDARAERMRITGGGRIRIVGLTSTANNAQTCTISDESTDSALGRGGNIGFIANINGTNRTVAGIGGFKGVAGTGDFSGHLALYTRRNNQSDLDERVRITSGGDLNVLAGQVSVTTPEFLRVAHTTNTHNQNLTDNSTVLVRFGSVYDDTKSGWIGGAGNYYTIQKAGYFLVTAQAVFHSNTISSLRDWALGVEQSTDNGNTYSLIQNAGGRGGGNDNTDTDAIATCVTFILNMSAGTRIRVRAHANTDGGDWQIDEDLGDVTGGNDYGGSGFDNQKGTRLHIIRLF